VHRPPWTYGIRTCSSKINAQCWKFCVEIVLVYLQPFWRNSLLKCVSQPEIAKKITTPVSLGGSRSFKILRSSMLTFVWSAPPVLVMMCSMSVPICYRLHAIQANSGKISKFLGCTSLSRPHSRGTPSPRRTKFCHDKLEVLWQPTDFLILDPSLHLFDTTQQCDERTDRRTDTETVRWTPRRWLRCVKHYMLSHVKTIPKKDCIRCQINYVKQEQVTVFADIPPCGFVKHWLSIRWL